MTPGNDLALGRPANLLARPSGNAAALWNRADETSKVMLPGGWLRPGDVAVSHARGFVYSRIAEGQIRFRASTSIRTKWKPSPSHPRDPRSRAVAAARRDTPASRGAFRVPWRRRRGGRRWGPVATGKGRHAYCRQSLSAIQVPKHVYFRAEAQRLMWGRS